VNLLALNSSPHMEAGGTGLILNPLLEGARQAGAAVELIYVRRLSVKPCEGCLDCWLRTPGRCRLNDDMQMLYPRLAGSDVLVLATPVYADGMNGPMKTLIDRCLPLLEPFFEVRDGHCRHPVREGVSGGKLALVAVCGFAELDNFDPLLCHVRALCKNLGREFAGALLRPYAAALPELDRRRIPVKAVYEAARQAGRELVLDGAIGSETAAAVCRELVRREVYIRAVNAGFRRALRQTAPQ